MRKFVAIMLVAVTLMLCACSPAKRIVGSWKTQSTVLGVVVETTYVFNEDGTGKKCGAVDIPFTYAVEESKLRISTSVIGVEVSQKEYEISFKGSTLVLTNGDELIELTKVKQHGN